MLDFYVIINSYEREQMLNQLLIQLKTQLMEYKYEIHVYLDGCSYDKLLGGVHYHHEKHHGKDKYYKLVEKSFKNARKAKFYLKLDDDLSLHDNFVENLVSCYESIQDKEFVALNLLRDERNVNYGWHPKPYNDLVRLTQWTDLIFMTDRDSFKYFCPGPKPDFIQSSGVARQLTRFFNRRGNIYQVNESLVSHGDHESKMNPERKEKITNI